MLKSTARAQQFQERSGSESTKGSRKGFSLLGGGECAAAVLTDTQRDEAERHALHGRMATLGEEIAKVRLELGTMRSKTCPAFYELIARRNKLTDEKSTALTRVQALNSRIRSAVPKPNANSVPAAFMEAAREMLTEAQFKILLKAAYDRANNE